MNDYGMFMETSMVYPRYTMVYSRMPMAVHGNDHGMFTAMTRVCSWQRPWLTMTDHGKFMNDHGMFMETSIVHVWHEMFTDAHGSSIQ